jgi:hypothetical protein
MHESLKDDPSFSIDLHQHAKHRDAILSKLRETNSPLFLSIEGHPYVSLDANLLAIDLGFFSPQSSEAKTLYSALKSHPLLTTHHGVPSLSTVPNYPSQWVGWVEYLFGVRNYHDEMAWSWLMGFAGKVARLMNDEPQVQLIFSTLEKMAERDGAIGEVYHSYAPFDFWNNASGSYHSERPFSWGAGMIVDGLRDE